MNDKDLVQGLRICKSETQRRTEFSGIAGAIMLQGCVSAFPFPRRVFNALDIYLPERGLFKGLTILFLLLCSQHDL